jgi:hypothetical protein
MLKKSFSFADPDFVPKLHRLSKQIVQIEALNMPISLPSATVWIFIRIQVKYRPGKQPNDSAKT